MNRIRIFGEVTHSYEQIVELSDEELREFRDKLDGLGKKGWKEIDVFLAKDYADINPTGSSCGEWSAELVDQNDKLIEVLDVE
jgi:hypothetical protein